MWHGEWCIGFLPGSYNLWFVFFVHKSLKNVKKNITTLKKPWNLKNLKTQTLCSKKLCFPTVENGGCGWWQSGRHTLSYDGLMNVLEMRKTRAYDSGLVRVIGKNPLGEVDCSTTLTVTPHDDLRAGLRRTTTRTSRSRWCSAFYLNVFFHVIKQGQEPFDHKSSAMTFYL